MKKKNKPIDLEEMVKVASPVLANRRTEQLGDRLPKRKYLRLRDYNYSSEGAYFVTICTQNRQSLFGKTVDGIIRLDEPGRRVQATWQEIPNLGSGIQIDTFCVMPNHVHGIILLVGADLRVRPNEVESSGPTHRSAPTLGSVIQWFKTMTTNYYIRGVKEKGRPSFRNKLWQRNYYERVIRNESELFQMRRYIQENPLKWDLDPENPSKLVTVS